MKYSGVLPNELQRYDESMGGVFSHADLAHLMGAPFGSTLQARIAALVKRGYLQKAQRGWYYSGTAKLDVLACRIKPGAYISLTRALVKRGLVGTNPQGIVDLVVSRGRPQIIRTGLGVIRIHRQTPDAHFGFEDLEGIPVATAEKAVIDCCYFHLRGARFPFQLEADINWGTLNPGKIRQILEAYKNPKFKTFVINLLETSHGS
jgi:hypothetical protein